jgi:riboflavin kinase / FMN adenylyltransferase
LSLQLIKGIEEYIPSGHKITATIGTFDGIHRGHQSILKRLMLAAKNDNTEALAITFEPHPRVLVTPDSPPPLLTVWEEKVRLFGHYMSGKVLILNFSDELMRMTAEEFTRSLLIEKINIRKLIVGYDHAFGRNRSGTINDLMELGKKYSFELEMVDPVIVEGKPISSSRIRRLIYDKQFLDAVAMLGHAYPIIGRVVRGIGLGRKMGYPTANLKVQQRKLLPPEGVYGCSVNVDKVKYNGMMFIGVNHFNPQAGLSVEVNIFNFDRDIYDQDIICCPEHFIRENKLFGQTTELSTQIGIDKENILRIIKEGENRNVC